MTYVRLSRVTNYQLLPTATNQNGRQTGGHFCVKKKKDIRLPKAGFQEISGELDRFTCLLKSAFSFCFYRRFRVTFELIFFPFISPERRISIRLNPVISLT